MAVAGPEPLAGDGETPRLRPPAPEREHGGGARFQATEDGAVGDDGIGGAYGEHLGARPTGEGEAQRGTDGRASRAEGHDDDVGFGPSGDLARLRHR